MTWSDVALYYVKNFNNNKKAILDFCTIKQYKLLLINKKVPHIN